MESNQETKVGDETPNLTPRQWWLHDFLERQAMFFPDKWWTQAEIVSECQKPVSEGGYANYEKDGYQKRASLRSHEVCAAITIDMAAINESPKADTIIMLQDATYKMPNTVEEGENYLKATILKRSARGMYVYWHQLRKLKRDGQYKMFANSGRLMPEGDEQKAERWVTSVVHLLDEEDKKKKGEKKNGSTKNVQHEGD